MRLTNLYVIYDTEGETTSGLIIQSPKDRPAIRTFYTVLADKSTLPGLYPEQFELRWVGELDEETANLHGIEPQTIATGKAWLAAQDRAGDRAIQFPTPDVP